jgi:hypothetical protein
MTRLSATLLIPALFLSGCGGRFSDSGLNPFGWFSGGGSRQAATLAPEGGYGQNADQRPGIAQILSAGWQPLNEGRLLVVTGMAPSKGYSQVALITARPQPSGRAAPDEDGILRLRLVGVPPLPDSAQATIAAAPATDTLTAGLALSNIQLARIRAVEISGAANVVRLNR